MRTDDAPPETADGRSLTTQAFERLRGDILSGRLQPSQRLRIQALSDHYQIGATAIREALFRLLADGLVESEDQRGFNVAPVAKEDVFDLIDTRIELESSALRSSIERGGIEWESALLANYHRLVKTPPPSSPENLPAWDEAHRRFHEALLAGCQSRWTLKMCRMLFDQSERYRNLAYTGTSKYKRDLRSEHRLLMEATMARDPEKATQLLADHYTATKQIILKDAFEMAGGAGKPAQRRGRKLQG